MKYLLSWLLLLGAVENICPSPTDLLLIDKNRAISQDIIFERFTSEHGLPDDRIRSIYQDKTGFLWIGTMNGLSKYDGHTFKKFQKNFNKNSIVGNWTFAICEDSLQRLWIGTLEGLSCFDPKSEIYTNYQHVILDDNSLIFNEIYSMMFDHYGYLWIGTAKGLTKFDLSKQEFQRFNNYPFNTAIAKIIRSQGDYIWISTSEGVVHYNIVTDEYDFYKVTVDPNPFGERFWSMLETGRDLLIATGSHGLIKLPFNYETNTYGDIVSMNFFQGNNESFENMQIFDICKSVSGDIWLGTANGLAKIENLDSNSPRLFFYKHNPLNNRSISNNSVYKVYIDNTDVLWCGTESGLNKSDLTFLSFKYYTYKEQQSKAQTRSVFCSNTGDVWIGMALKGFFQYNYQNKVSSHYKFSPETSPFNATRSILFDDGNLWLGTLGGTLKIDKNHKYSKEFDGATFALLKDSKDNHWIGTNKGLHKISKSGVKHHYPHYQHNLVSTRTDFVRTIYEDHKGFIWCGFENDGVSKLNPLTEEFTHIGKDMEGRHIFGTTILSILEYPENVIWIGSESGLSKIIYDKNGNYTIRNFSENDGLSDKSISGILSDNKGCLWISSIKGLMRFNIEKETFEYFLTDFNFSTDCCFKARDGSFFFGSEDGFIVFNPDNVHSNQHIPQTAITDLKLFNQVVAIGDTVNGDVVLSQSITQIDEIILNHKNNFFSIDFTALHFSDPTKCRFSFILKGFNPEWIFTDGQNRTATYTNLNAGTYTFLVKAANPSGFWNDNPSELRIIILPPPWKTWWAIGLYSLISIGILLAVIRYYILQIRQRQQIEIEKREKEQLVQLNHMKLKFFIDVAHEFRTPLMLIAGPVQELLSSETFSQKVRLKIEMIHRNCAKLNYLIDELMTFRKIDQEKMILKYVKMDIVLYINEIFNSFKPFADQKRTHFIFQSDISECLVCIDPQKLEKVFNNLLLNAFKFTKEEDTIYVTITDSAEYICIRVEDTGKGIASENLKKIFDRFYQVDSNIAGTGIGLSLAKSLVELHHGKITVDSEQNVFTRFNVFLPKNDGNINSGGETDVFVHEWKPDNASHTLQITNTKQVSDDQTIQTGEFDKLQHVILLVDDNPEVLSFLSAIFEGTYRVCIARDGEEALKIIQSSDVDIVISDVMMSVMDGITLCKALKNSFSTCHIPVILLTAKSAIEHIIEGIQVGADDYIAKPFYPEILKARVRNLIESRRRMTEKFKSDKISNLKNIANNRLDQEFIQQLLEITIANIHNADFDVVELSSIIGMSRSSLFRKLKAISGQTPIDFINSIRMKLAAELVIENRMNITEISSSIGFQNISSFSRAFKKYFNVTPSEYSNKMDN